jgi:hypothetical protein
MRGPDSSFGQDGAAGEALAAFRRALRGHPPRPPEGIDVTPEHRAADLPARAAAMLAGGWGHAGGHLDSLRPPIAWDGHGRQFAFDLHCWAPCGLLLHAAHRHPDRGLVEAAFGFAQDWLDRFQAPVLAIEGDGAAMDALVAASASDFAWYDMALGLRCARLAALLEAVARDPAFADPAVAGLLRALRFHLQALSSAAGFRAHSNHGIYQALGSLAAARRFPDLPGFAAWGDEAEARLTGLVLRQVTAEGVHREHSPGYHRMLLDSLRGAVQAGLVSEPVLLARIAAMEAPLSWLIAPDLTLATFGDTDLPLPLRGPGVGDLYADPSLRGQFGASERAAPPRLGTACWPEGGYAVARLLPAGTPEAAREDSRRHSWFAQAAGFHSKVHKHADHLGFIWHEAGRRILTDPGRFAYAGLTEPGSELHRQGFWYADPRRIHVEETRAHNAVEVDGQSHPRRVRPFGSALRGAGMQGPLFVTDCACRPVRGVQQWRGIVLHPGHFLLVLDWLHDASGAAHDYRQWFCVDPAWTVTLEAGGLYAGRAADGAAWRAAALFPGARPAPPQRGAAGPPMQGWISDAPHSLVPAPAFHLAAAGAGPCSFATLFVIGEVLVPDRVASRSNATLGLGRLLWQDAAGSWLLDVEGGVRKPFLARFGRRAGSRVSTLAGNPDN